MAGRGIRIPFFADVSDFIRGTRDLERGLDDTADALDDFAQDAERATEKAERSFRDMAQDVKRSTDRVERETTSSMREVGKEAGSEFSQNFGEAIRGGNPAEALVETVTSLSGALGPLGIGLAAAFGIGAAIANEISQSAQKVRDAANGLFEAARGAGIDAAAREDFVNSILGTDSWAESLRTLAPLARQAGVPIGDVVREIETGGEAVTDLDRALAGARKRADELGQGSGPQAVAAALGPAGAAALALAGYYEDGATALSQQNDLLLAQRDIALNSIREVERAGRTARGVTNAERYEQESRYRQ